MGSSGGSGGGGGLTGAGEGVERLKNDDDNRLENALVDFERLGIAIGAAMGGGANPVAED